MCRSTTHPPPARERAWTRTGIPLFAGAVLFCSMGARARGAIQFDVFPGYGGLVLEVGWFPIACEIFNDGPAFNATVEFTPSFAGHGQPRRVRIELPARTRKRFFIPAFSSGTGFSSWKARLLDEEGKVKAERDGLRVTPIPWEGTLLGAVTRTFRGRPAFPESPKRNGELRPRVAWMAAELFPDTPIALEGLSAIYLNSRKALQLTPNQAKALTSWVVQGGDLILAIEDPAEVHSLPWLRGLLPFEPSGMSAVTAGEAFLGWIQSDASSRWKLGSLRTFVASSYPAGPPAGRRRRPNPFIPKIGVPRGAGGARQRQFVFPWGLDLTPLLESGDAVVFAWDTGHGWTPMLHRSQVARQQVQTLFRLTVPLIESVTD